MALNAGSLAADLANRRELAPFWLVTGSEDLLMLESADLLRRRARELGYTDRQVLELSASADWSQLPDAAASIGMFDDKKFLEVRLPSGRPGIKGNKALPEFVERPVDGVVTLFTMPRPDWQGQKAAWSKPPLLSSAIPWSVRSYRSGSPDACALMARRPPAMCLKPLPISWKGIF